MKIEADLHVHTVASGHAYSTVEEITREAAKRGLKMVALTDHGPALPGGAHPYHFWNLRIMPSELNGVRILKGVEANITNAEADLDLKPEYLNALQIVLVGFHPNCGYVSDTEAQNTATLIKAMDNPYTDFIAHPGNAKFPINPEQIVNAAAQRGIALEINNSSFLPTSSREAASDFDLQIIDFAKEKGLPLILSSDAHIYTQVGVVDKASELLKRAGVEPEQVLNTSVSAVLDYLAKRRAGR
ncbi:MAG: phosphatase [Firmicutes bacterium]|nr:phosphatase [Bacillota bacterium]